MTRIARLYDKLLANPSLRISFKELEALLAAFGFELRRQKGSHRHYKHPEVPEILTIQPRGKDALPYQVKQLLEVVRDYGPTYGCVKAAHYHINLFWSDEDGCWIANVPDLKYCSAHGDTPNEAIASIQEAIDGWLETARDAGLAIPEARYRAPSYAAG